MYFGVAVDDIPLAITTHIEFSDGAWYYQKSGTVNTLGENALEVVQEWAKEPLENEDIYLCSEGYSIRRFWADGTRALCDQIMVEKLNIDSSYLPQWDFSSTTDARCWNICGDSTFDASQCQLPTRSIDA